MGRRLRNHFSARREHRLTLGATRAALAALALNMLSASAALAEFEIQETEVEKGETEFEYRGAVHWGFPKREREEAEEGEEGGALEEEEEGELLRQSHDFEFQYGLTERWMISTTLSADEPLKEDFNLSSVEIELQYEVIAREGNGFGLAFIGAYGFATRGGEADEIEFAPFFELARGNFLFTGNPIFTAQVGDHRETDSLGFEYGWRAEYDFAKHWGIGAEMFGVSPIRGHLRINPTVSVRLYFSSPAMWTRTRLARQRRRMRTSQSRQRWNSLSMSACSSG